MCKVMEERVKDAEYRQAIDIAITMLRDGKLSNEDIAKYTGLSLETVHVLAEELKGVSA